MADAPKACCVCEKRLEAADFAKDRAISLLGKHYCARCADRKVQEKKTGRTETGGKSRRLLVVAIIALATIAGVALFFILR